MGWVRVCGEGPSEVVDYVLYGELSRRNAGMSTTLYDSSACSVLR